MIVLALFALSIILGAALACTMGTTRFNHEELNEWTPPTCPPGSNIWSSRTSNSAQKMIFCERRSGNKPKRAAG